MITITVSGVDSLSAGTPFIAIFASHPEYRIVYIN